MNHLHRDLAPISDDAWALLDDEATRWLSHYLTVRKLVDFSGPHGWESSSVDLGRTESPADLDGVEVRRRRTLPLSELRARFSLDRDELTALERGAGDADLEPLRDAARRLASAEDRLALYGDGSTPERGVWSSSPHPPISIGDDYDQYPSLVARAVATLQETGVGGPYALALGPRCYRGVVETTERGGLVVFEHLRLILGGPIVWAPTVSGALVTSQRGGDFELVCGQDLSLGYSSHDRSSVELYLEETLALRLDTPEAAVRLVYPS